MNGIPFGAHQVQHFLRPDCLSQSTCRARRDDICVNAILGTFFGECLGKPDDCDFGCGVIGLAKISPKTRS